MPPQRVLTLAIRAALAIIVVATIIQLAIGFSPIYLRFIEVVLFAVAVVPIVVVVLGGGGALVVWAAARLGLDRTRGRGDAGGPPRTRTAQGPE